MCELMKSSSNALDPLLGLMQYMGHLKFIEYLLRVAHERGRIADGRRSIFDARYSRNVRFSRLCMKPRVGSSALELDFINSHIYFHSLHITKIDFLPSAFLLPFKFNSQDILQKLKMFQILHETKTCQHEHVHFKVNIGHPIT